MTKITQQTKLKLTKQKHYLGPTFRVRWRHMYVKQQGITEHFTVVFKRFHWTGKRFVQVYVTDKQKKYRRLQKVKSTGSHSPV